MKDIFERLKTEGFAAINDIVSRRQQENVQLDFKQKARPTRPGLDRDDRRVLGPVLSSFANSNGGLVILGIVAKKDADAIDAANAIDPIDSLSLFKSDAQRAVAELLMPKHEGIEIEAIPDASGADRGFLAIWVERSELRPHRSEAVDDKRYYKRAGDSTFVMEHYDIQDAFNRRGPSQLSLVALPAQVRRMRFGSTEYILPFAVRNDARISAYAPYVWVGELLHAYAQSRAPTPFVAAYQIKDRQVFAADGGVFVHPGVEIPAFSLIVQVGDVLAKGSAYAHPVSFKYGVGSANARMVEGQFRWTYDKLNEIFGPWRAATGP